MKTKYYKFYFKRALNIILFFFFSASIYSQSCYHTSVDSIVSKVSIQSITKIIRELSGDTQTVIGGLPYTIISRYYLHEGNLKAAQYIYEKFQSYGLNPQYQPFSSTGTNVIAKKIGIKYPNQSIIICAHYDDMPTSAPAPGADDNASGTTGVLEAARILSQYNLNYTLIFAAWDEEEVGLNGSRAFADSAYAHGDSIISVFNLDMISYDSNNDKAYYLMVNPPSVFYGNLFLSAGRIYVPDLAPTFLLTTAGASDHLSFWNKGYKAICGIEDYLDLNPFTHSSEDKIVHLNMPYFSLLVKTAVASLAVLEKDCWINIEHVPLISNSDTLPRIATTVISSKRPIARFTTPVNYSPRMYYKINNGSFNFVNAFYANQDTFKFMFPGISAGNVMYYYFAAQDSLGTIVSTLPIGGLGISPPGTTAPSSFFSYFVTTPLNICSSSPVNIPPKAIILDTINVQSTKILYDVNINLTINHSNDEDLYIWIFKEGYAPLSLSHNNGGSGDNYTNTTFDDEAAISITQGTPPFTGSFKPESFLSIFDNEPIAGKWILKVYNNSSTITGQLVNWCVYAEYNEPIGIVNNQIVSSYSLSQNYPNPFNPVTEIEFSILKEANIKIIVYDILGRAVRTLINDDMKSGKYSINFNSSGLSSGLYFYTMYIDGAIFDTKKMVLLK